MTDAHDWYARYRREVEERYAIARGLAELDARRDAYEMLSNFYRLFGVLGPQK
jgi:hypothetical protein